MVTDAQLETQQRVGVWKLVLFLEVLSSEVIKNTKATLTKKKNAI